MNELLVACIGSLVLASGLNRNHESVQVSQRNGHNSERVPEGINSKPTRTRLWGFRKSSVSILRRLMKNHSSTATPDVKPKALQAQTLYSRLPLDNAVCTLLKHGYPTREDQPTVSRIIRMCFEAFAVSSMPVDDVVGFPLTSLVDNNDVASIEVNINIVADINAMVAFMESKTKAAKPTLSDPEATKDTRKQAKRVLRSLCDALSSTGNFVPHYWMHSAGIPQFVVRVPASKLGAKRDIFVNMFVNNPFVEWQDVLDSACRHLGTHEAQLAFFVRRWARERGIAYAMKGHLSPFTWTLLVIYYLRHVPSGGDEDNTDASAAVIELFVGFISFYLKRLLKCQDKIAISIDVDERDIVHAELVSSEGAADRGVHCMKDHIRTCDLQSPMDATQASGGVPMHSPACSNRALPCIENPFAPECDLGASMSSSNVFRLWEELWRASRLLEDCSALTLAELLSHWSPPGSANGSLG
eukprot:TRINITY_DN10198_c0_g1_i1.p1 TRINITY_DN10198_c0_g1~~TRINITY_DN10198_c0_g1_i1.p1  ORF type:complete len:535 (+),score=51.41 TRINITY_DN10198_c0_g1_i1:195-1607(+)